MQEKPPIPPIPPIPPPPESGVEITSLDPFKKGIPIAPKHFPQPRQDCDGRPTCARFNALVVTPTDLDLFGDHFLGQGSIIPQANHVLPELFQVLLRRLTHVKRVRKRSPGQTRSLRSFFPCRAKGDFL